MAVVRELDLRVDAGEVVALIGANGAGKTTTLLTLAGELTPLDGEVRFLGAADPGADARAVPKRPRLRHRGAIGDHGHVGRRQPQARRASARQVAFEYFPALERIMDRRAGLCSGGEQQMLSLARALGRHPTLLLADELSLGLAPIIVANLLQAVRARRRRAGRRRAARRATRPPGAQDRGSRLRDGARTHRAERHVEQRCAGQLDKIEAAYLAESF